MGALLGHGGISLLHLSWGCPRRALPVILALWSPDFPHLGPFGSHPRLSAPVADLLYFMGRKKSNVLQILFREDILYNVLIGAAQHNIHKLEFGGLSNSRSLRASDHTGVAISRIEEQFLVDESRETL